MFTATAPPSAPSPAVPAPAVPAAVPPARGPRARWARLAQVQAQGREQEQELRRVLLVWDSGCLEMRSREIPGKAHETNRSRA